MNTSKPAIKRLVEKEWINWALELPVLFFYNMKRLEERELDEGLIQKSEVLQSFQLKGLNDFKVFNLLHLHDPLRVSNEVLLVCYQEKPFMVIQTINGGMQDEVVINQKVLRDIIKVHPAIGYPLSQEEIEVGYTGDVFSIVASSDHILAYDGEALYSADTRHFPTIE
ncbi:hypothetical protein [Rossellomorea marisflavi]|uniref:hypothetical protein n=1 Tax=Rossellomorea marisflavi TaxID=189381 RepID=UPI003F9EDD4E